MLIRTTSIIQHASTITFIVYCVYWIISTIHIRAHAIVLLTERIHPVPTCSDGIVLPCPVVVGVQAVHPVQFLAVVLVGLHVAVRGAVAELRPERIVVHALDDCSVRDAVGLGHLADAAEMVAVVVVEGEVVLAGFADVLCRLAVALVELELVYPPVPHREAAAEEVVRGVRAQDLDSFMYFVQIH